MAFLFTSGDAQLPPLGGEMRYILVVLGGCLGWLWLVLMFHPTGISRQIPSLSLRIPLGIILALLILAVIHLIYSSLAGGKDA
jgi:hypothetical protein